MHASDVTGGWTGIPERDMARVMDLLAAHEARLGLLDRTASQQIIGLPTLGAGSATVGELVWVRITAVDPPDYDAPRLARRVVETSPEVQSDANDDVFMPDLSGAGDLPGWPSDQQKYALGQKCRAIVTEMTVLPDNDVVSGYLLYGEPRYR